MENEKYGIELEAKTNLFKKGLNEAIKYTKAFGQGLKESFGEEIQKSIDSFREPFEKLRDELNSLNEDTNNISISPNINLKELTEWREEVQKLLQDTKESQQMASTKSVAQTFNKDIEWYENALSAINKRINELNPNEEELNENLEDTDETAKKTSSSLSSLFDDSIRKIKRFTYYLLGARSVFSLFMKYQSIYYQYNEQMQYQSELSQNAIALSLAPAFELLGNVMTYASIAFAKFIELLTGVNVLSKVTTKGIRDYNKSLKETQTLVSGIDEITNLNNPQNLGLAGQYQALADFQKKVAEVEKFFEENKWIQGLADGIQAIWKAFGQIYEYISDHWDIFKYLFGAVAVTSILGFALTSPGVGVLTLTLTVLGLAYALSEIDRLKKEIKEMKLGNLKKYPDVFEKIVGRINKAEKGSEEWNKQLGWLNIMMSDVVDEIYGGQLSYEEYVPIIDEIIEKLQGLDDEDFDAQIDLLMDIKNAKMSYDELFKYMTNKKIVIDLSTSFVQGSVDGILSLLDKNKYANGLDYVPYDNYPALLHKGETVVPAKYNPTIHSVGNDYTNSLLETMILKLDDLASRPNVFEIDGQQFARTTYPLLENERRNYSYNEGVSR